jgi:hypothetical protein
MPSPMTWIALATAGFVGWSALRKAREREAAKPSPAKPRALQTWEGEGGGLPNGGPQLPRVETRVWRPPSEKPL